MPGCIQCIPYIKFDTGSFIIFEKTHKRELFYEKKNISILAHYGIYYLPWRSIM